jgi:agmatinase
MAFDPDAAAQPDAGIFGLPTTRRDAKVILIPVPYDGTTSYGRGTSQGPQSILYASWQVDLFDRRFGRIYEKGLHMIDIPEIIYEWSDQAGELSAPIIESGGGKEKDSSELKKIEAFGRKINDYVFAESKKVLESGKIPGVVGGEHSVPFGNIQACAEAHEAIGILHIDAHMDLRAAFEGFTWSHASIMHNVLTRLPKVTKLVQVGIRDFGEGELEFAKSQGERVVVFYDDVMAERQLDGEKWKSICAEMIGHLPAKVYVSFDIDGLDPSLCPNTGTPVPGGLSFHQASMLLAMLKDSGKTLVGFDLVEVSPEPHHGMEFDANVGARVLYKMCGVC